MTPQFISYPESAAVPNDDCAVNDTGALGGCVSWAVPENCTHAAVDGTPLPFTMNSM